MKSDDASWVEEVMSTQYVKIVTEVEEKLDKAQDLLEELKNGYRATMLQEGEKISYDGIIHSTNIVIGEVRDLLNLREIAP